MDVDRSILIYALGLVGEAYGEGKAVKVAKGESTKGFNPSGRASPSAPARGSGPSRARRGGGGGGGEPLSLTARELASPLSAFSPLSLVGAP